MSDPVSNAEIEDVLSSIRRLVSEEPSPLLRRKKIAESVKERFVLTPALRVSDDDGEEVEAPPVAPLKADETPSREGAVDPAPKLFGRIDPEAGSGNQDRLAGHRQTLEQRIAELESALQQSPEEWEPDGSEVDARLEPVIPDFDSQVIEAESDDPPSAKSDGDKSAIWLSDLPDDDPSDDPAVDEEAPDVEIAEPDLPKAAGDDAEDDPRPEETEDAAVMSTAADPQTEPQDVQPAQPESQDPEVAELGAFAHLHEDQGNDPEPWEDDEDDAVDEARGADKSALNADVETEAGQDNDDGEGDETGFTMFSEDAVLDEESLRDMVSQLVREELQGVLGERITRNVRRLVRREIQRAMAVRDLE